MEYPKITAATDPKLKNGDIVTIAGIGYDKKDRAIQNGRFVKSGKKTKSKIVRLQNFTIGGVK